MRRRRPSHPGRPSDPCLHSGGRYSAGMMTSTLLVRWADEGGGSWRGAGGSQVGMIQERPEYDKDEGPGLICSRMLVRTPVGAREMGLRLPRIDLMEAV